MPVTAQDVHASLLMFPHVVRILGQINAWVKTAAL